MVARTVVAGHAGAVDAEDDRQPVEADVVVELVPGPVEERRVDRDDRPEAADGHSGRGGDRVLLGDADVDEAIGEPAGERQQPGRPGHRRGDGDDVRSAFGFGDERGAERFGVGRRRQFELGPAGRDVERADVVQALLRVGLGREVALALDGVDVDDDGAGATGGPPQSVLDGVDVVAVDGTAVPEPERTEERARCPVCLVGGPVPDPAVSFSDTASSSETASSFTGGGREAGNGRRVRPAVVVQDDDDGGAGGADVAERFVREPAGQGTVADDRDDTAAAGRSPAAAALATPVSAPDAPVWASADARSRPPAS